MAITGGMSASVAPIGRIPYAPTSENISCFISDFLVNARRQISLLLVLPQSHHAPLRIGEEAKPPHAGYLLLLEVNLAASSGDLLAICREIIDGNIKDHVAGPRPF